MEDDWEDFLGLDDKPSDHKKQSSAPSSTPPQDDDDLFHIPEQLGHLDPSKDTTDLLSDDQVEECDSPTYEKDDTVDSFDMDLLSLKNDSVPSEQPDTSTEIKANDTVEASDFLDSPIPEEKTSVENGTPSSREPDEFISWLDDKKSSENKTPSENTTTPNTKLMMDSFFDEVFGEDENTILSGKTVTASQNFESLLRKEITSAFCDVNKLRGLILGAGYLPKALRAQIWSILTGGSCNEDQEAEFWRPSGNEIVENKSSLISDCKAIVLKVDGTLHSPADVGQAEIDMSDILLLYCMRRKKKYERYYSTLLSPLLVTPLPTSRALASSCFYSLCSEFVPLINLSPHGYKEAVNKLSEWIRLLISYHFPLLVIHLDRVFPAWERSLKCQSTAEMMSINEEKQKNSNLDIMEKECGLVGEELNISYSNSKNGCISSQLPKEDKRHSNVSSGCIPPLWLSGIFGDSLPPEQACAVMDWAILNEEKYFGVYFTASLFGLYSSSLMSMNRTQIVSWIQKVNSGVSGDNTQWFSHIPLTAAPSLGSTDLIEMSEDAADKCEMDWNIFMRGWLHSSTAMRHTTPSSFQEAMGNTELWASNLVVEEDTAALKRKDMDESGGNDNSKRAKMLQMKNAMEEKSRRVLKRFSKKVEVVRKAPQGFDIDNLDKWEEDEEVGKAWPHVSKKNFRCLWASASEVIPSMVATQHKSVKSPEGTAGEGKSILEHFCRGCEWSEGCSDFGVERKGGEGMCFPQLRDELHSMLSSPTYFTVDIRSESELKLGKFPKAFCLDPQHLSDPDMISSYLSTLEPVSEIAHLCVMGIGEEYIQAKVSEGASESSHSSLDTPSTSFALLGEALEQYHATLMNVVVFFMKKGFRHVSILDGGFIAAVRHLLRDDCTSSIGTALVDVFPPALDRILGDGTCAKHLGIRKQDMSNDLYSDVDKANVPNGSTLGASVNNAFANFSSSAVGTNLGSFVSNLTSQVSTGTTQNETTEPTQSTSAAEVGRRLSVLGTTALSSLRKTVGATTQNPNTTPSSKDTTGISQMDTKYHKSKVASKSESGMKFVIDEDDDEEDDVDDDEHDRDSIVSSHQKEAIGNEDPEDKNLKASRLADTIPDTDSVNVTRSEAEKSQALAMHVLAGVQKGDEVKIEKASLPGAVLFPALKDKIEKDEDGLIILDTKGDPKTKPVHRFLVVTKERFIVLDTKGQGVGSTGHVKSNHHLTELIKITFKKKDPDGVILYISSPGKEPKPHSYKVAKRNDFIKTLQEKMKRFK